MTDLLKFCDSTESRIWNLESRIVEEARTWIGTPFRHQGRIKTVGVDCLGLLVGVAAELELGLERLDELGYGHFPDSDYLQNKLTEAMEVIDEPTIGGIGLFEIDGRAQHLGIFGECTLIHAYAPMRKVVEHGFTDEWKERLIKSYSLA